MGLWCRAPCMEKRTHPFPGKVTFEDAEEIRRLRRRGKPLADLAGRFNLAKSSVSRICHLHAHTPPGTLRVALPDFEFALLQELADDEAAPIEQLASELLLETLRNRIW